MDSTTSPSTPYPHSTDNHNAPIQDRDDPDYYRLWIIRQISNNLNSKFSLMHCPADHMAVDEIIINLKEEVIFWKYTSITERRKHLVQRTRKSKGSVLEGQRRTTDLCFSHMHINMERERKWESCEASSSKNTHPTQAILTWLTRCQTVIA
jgi:hypothetical protein